jgi:hypothetical protein
MGNHKAPDSGDLSLPIETRAAPIVGNSVDEAERTVEVIWTTGARFDRMDWFSGERYVEELVVTEKAVKLDRLNSGGPVLDNHNRFGGVGDMLAVVERAWIEKGEGRAKIRFPKEGISEAADKIFRLIADGIITRLSCGYVRNKIEVDKTKDPKVWRVVDWEPFEISFVSVPADVKAKVRSDDAPTYRCAFVSVSPKPSAIDAARRRMALAARAVGLTD